MADLYYYEAGYIDEGYHVYTADAVVDIGPWIVEGYFEPGYIVDYSSQATLSCDAEILTGVTVEASGTWTSTSSLTAAVGRIQEGASALVVTASITATISHLNGVDIVAFANAAIAVQISVIRSNNIAATAVFDIATDGRRFRDIAAAETAAFEFDVINSRSRAFTIETQAAFSLAASVSKLKEASAALSVTASQSVDATKYFGIIQTLSSAFTVYARPKFGVTWVNSNGESIPTSTSLGTSGTVIDSSEFKFGSGSLKLPVDSTERKGIVTKYDGNELSIPDQTTNFSISFWVKMSGATLGGKVLQVGDIVNNTTSSANKFYSIDVNGGFLTFTYKFGGNTTRQYTHLGAMSQANWNFVEVAGVWNGSNRVTKIYINGVEKSVVGDVSLYLTTAIVIGNGRNGAMLLSNSSRDVWIDDFQFRTGADSVIGTSLPSVQATPAASTKTLLNLNGSFIDAVGTITIPGAAALSSTASLSATVESIKLVDASGSFASEFTQTASGDLIKDVNAAMQTSVTVSATAQRTFDVSSAATSTSTLDVTGQVTRTLASEFAAAFAQTTTGQVTRTLASNLTTEVTQTTDAVKFVDADIATDAIATELVSVAKIGDFLITCETVASLNIAPVVTASGAAELTDEFTVDVTGNAIIDNQSILAAQASSEVINDRLRDFDSAFANEFAIVVNATNVSVNASTISSYFTLNGSAMNIKGVSSTQSMSSALIADISITKDFYCDLAAEAAFNASVTATLAADIALISNSSLNAIISHIEGADIVVDSFATMTATVEAGMFGQAALESTTSLAADNVRVRFADSAVNSVSTVTAQINEIVPLYGSLSSVTTQVTAPTRNASAGSALTTTSTLSATISHIEGADIVVDGFAALSATAINLRGGSSALAASSTLTAVVNEVVQLAATLSANVTLSVNATIAQNGAAAITSVASVTATALAIKQLTASINSAMTFTADVLEVDIDSINQTVYVIPAEDREWTITREIWSRNIPEETREYII